jgi:hypothetical protein
MEENCKECRYCGMAKTAAGRIDFCLFKKRPLPKNTCKRWRPKEEARK